MASNTTPPSPSPSERNLTVRDLRARWRTGRTRTYEVCADPGFRARVRTMRVGGSGPLRFREADIEAEEANWTLSPATPLDFDDEVGPDDELGGVDGSGYGPAGPFSAPGVTSPPPGLIASTGAAGKPPAPPARAVGPGLRPTAPEPVPDGPVGLGLPPRKRAKPARRRAA